jgi:hypothetical protein
MANKTIYSGKDFRIGIAPQSAFATANTTEAQFYELLITDSPQMDWGGLIRESTKRSNSKRVKDNKDVFVQTAGGTYTVSVSGVLTDTTVDLLVGGVMNDVESEGASTPYTKVLEWDSSTTQPDFGGDSGQMFTILLYSPASGESIQLKTAVLQSLSISGDPGSNGGRLGFSATFYTGFAPTYSATATPSSWVTPATDYYIFQQAATKTVGGSAIVAGSFSVDFANGAARVGFDSSGNPETYSMGLGDGYAVSGEISAKYDPNTKDLIDTFLTNPQGGSAESNIIMEWGTGGADGHLKFDFNALFTGNSQDFGNEAGVFVSLPFEGVDDGTNEAVEVTISNATDRAW